MTDQFDYLRGKLLVKFDEKTGHLVAGPPVEPAQYTWGNLHALIYHIAGDYEVWGKASGWRSEIAQLRKYEPVAYLLVKFTGEVIEGYRQYETLFLVSPIKNMGKAISILSEAADDALVYDRYQYRFVQRNTARLVEPESLLATLPEVSNEP